MKDFLENIVMSLLVVLTVVGTIAAAGFYGVFILLFTVLSQKEFWYLIIIGMFIWAFI